MHAKNSEKVPVKTSAKESEVLEKILPKQKRRWRKRKLRIRRRYL